MCIELPDSDFVFSGSKTPQKINFNVWPETNCRDRSYNTEFTKYFNAPSQNFGALTDS